MYKRQVLPALASVGEDMGDERVLRAERWIIEHQNDDGGWGESCASYMELELAGKGVSTASQTAWALIALLTADNLHSSDAIRRGLDFLTRTQKDDSWDEPYYTGTGFPGYGFGARLKNAEATDEVQFAQGPELARAFMINYNMYRHYFPLIALGRARNKGYA